MKTELKRCNKIIIIIILYFKMPSVCPSVSATVSASIYYYWRVELIELGKIALQNEVMNAGIFHFVKTDRTR